VRAIVTPEALATTELDVKTALVYLDPLAIALIAGFSN
jgi:hypothetical protein